MGQTYLADDYIQLTPRRVGLFAERPAANAVTPYTDRYMATDVGVGGSEWYSDGTKWRAVGGQVVLKNDATGAATVAHTVTTEQLMLSYALPLGLVQANDVLVVEALRAKTGDTATSFQMLLHFGKLNTVADPYQQISSLASTTIVGRSNHALKVTSDYVNFINAGVSLGYDTSTAINSNGTQTGVLAAQQYLGVYGRWNVAATSGAIGYLNDLRVTLITCG